MVVKKYAVDFDAKDKLINLRMAEETTKKYGKNKVDICPKCNVFWL